MAANQEPGRLLLGTLLMLTVISGLVDAVSYLGLGHVFTANMTGNVVLLGFAAAGASGSPRPPASPRSARFWSAPPQPAGSRGGWGRGGTCSRSR